MIEIVQLLIGAFWTAMLAGGSWCIGLVMGLALGKLLSARSRPGNDVDELLRRQRAANQVGRPAAAPAASGAVGK